jgi:2-oxoglutarate dehydrogenase E2 component (dihydrolipoamide succinyltransferase)
VRRIAEEQRLDPGAITGSGKRGQVTKADVLAAVQTRARPAEPVRTAPAQETRATPAVEPVSRPRAEREERVPMSRVRRTIAQRLKESQEIAAQLTTFNEADMSAIMELRNNYKDAFEKKHGVRLGFMGFFVKACVATLKEIPVVNAEIDGDDIVYKHYYDIGIAVSTDRGLVVPVLRDADAMPLAAIEKRIAEFGARARENKLKLEELLGGTFTISNGGVFGSLMSTPILNMPQSGVLGMHKIQNRPVAIGDRVEVRPMMYLALSYDHRLVDGRDAVTFLVRVKENLEDPQRLLLDL